MRDSPRRAPIVYRPIEVELIKFSLMTPVFFQSQYLAKPDFLSSI